MDLDDVLACCPSAKPSGTGWQVRPRRPVRPSLSTAEGADGCAPIHCHANCIATVVADLEVADLVIADLAADLIIKDERIASLEADVVAYRELAFISVERVASLTTQIEHVTRQRDASRNDYAGFRATVKRARMEAA